MKLAWQWLVAVALEGARRRYKVYPPNRSTFKPRVSILPYPEAGFKSAMTRQDRVSTLGLDFRQFVRTANLTQDATSPEPKPGVFAIIRWIGARSGNDCLQT
jgi:hypothetical protein